MLCTKKHDVKEKTKLTTFKTILKLVLLYGCESWTLTKQQKVKYRKWKGRIRNGVVKDGQEVEANKKYLK